MNFMKTLKNRLGLCGAILLGFTGSLSYGQDLVIDISTGRNTSGAAISMSSFDDTWTVLDPTTTPATLLTPKTCSWSTWANAGVDYRWISPKITATGGLPAAVTAGTYLYRASFNIPSTCSIGSASINLLKIGGDDFLRDLRINGTTITNPFGLVVPNHYSSLNIISNLTLTIPPGVLHSGSNQIEIPVETTQQYSGLLINGNISINYAPNMVTQITGNDFYCYGSPLSFTGTVTSGTSTEQRWKIEQCNADGSLVSGGSSWISPWSTTNLGAYTFPAGATAGCGKTYKVTFATKNACTPNLEKSMIINIICPPKANAGPDINLCAGLCATIGINTPQYLVSYLWTYVKNGTTYTEGTTSPLSVCPEETRTYKLTTTSLLFGCMATDEVTVNLKQNDPKFNLTTNSLSGNYTVSATAVDPNANLIPGFEYYWIIQEMNGGTPYYSYSGNSCWAVYPGDNKFFGFRSTGAGTYTQSTSCTTPGTFRYGAQYRFTRATRNLYCSTWDQFSLDVSATLRPDGTTVFKHDEVKEVQDLSFLANEATMSNTEHASETKFNVYPNPSTGVFSINADVTEGYLEVRDVLGRTVKNISFNTPSPYAVDLSELPRGIYILNLSSGNASYSQKIILE